jgi:hypothetical protein
MDVSISMDGDLSMDFPRLMDILTEELFIEHCDFPFSRFELPRGFAQRWFISVNLWHMMGKHG